MKKFKQYIQIWQIAKTINQGGAVVANFNVKAVNLKGATNITFYEIHADPQNSIEITVAKATKEANK